MGEQPQFRSLGSLLDLARGGSDTLPPDLARQIRSQLDHHRDKQDILHFETADGALGPGRLVGYDLDQETVAIQLRGECEIRTLGFDTINDFGPAAYENPKTMGDALVGVFWEARTARKHLERMVANSYARLSPEEVDSFERIIQVRESEIADLVPLSLSEGEVKQRICDIVGNSYVQADWGGEQSDIFCNITFRRRTTPAAFLLKGRSYADRPLRITDLGKNGDQLVRMFAIRAEVFVVQSNGPIDATVYNHVQAQVADKLLTNQPVYYLILDGAQTARLLRAYGKI